MTQDELKERAAGLSAGQRAALEQVLLSKAGRRERPQGIPRREGNGPCPASFTQQRLWFIEQLEPGTGAYNVSNGYRLKGALDVDALRRAFSAIVERHEALRTTFASVDGTPVQVVGPAVPVEMCMLDVSGEPSEQREQAARRLLEQEAGHPFDLARDLMIRPVLARLAEDEHILLIVIHHVATDGWSSQVLRRELSELYGAFVAGREPRLPELPLQYGDFAAWQVGQMQGPVLEGHLRYWRERLTDAPLLELPTDRQRPPAQTYRGADERIVLPAELADGVRALARRSSVTPFMVLLAALNVLLHRYTGQEDIVVGMPIANRVQEELEGLVGFFANTLALRTDLSGDPTFSELLVRVRDIALEAYSHQDLPFEKLVAELQPERSLSYTPVFQVAFAFQNTPRSGLELPGLSVDRYRVESGTSKFDLTFTLNDEPGAMTGHLEYATDLFEPQTAARMVGHLSALLSAAAADPDRPISRLPMLSEEERRLVTVDWAQNSAPYPAEACVHELFEAQARRTPEAVALVADERTLTYAELDERSGALAGRLAALGVRTGSIVGICSERTPEMVVGMLAILKAGGAYMPLNANYPAARLEFMVRDAGARVILVQGDAPEALNGLGARGGAAGCSRRRGRRRERLRHTDDGEQRTTNNGQRRTPYGRRPRLRDLHQRLDGHAEGHGDTAPRRRAASSSAPATAASTPTSASSTWATSPSTSPRSSCGRRCCTAGVACWCRTACRPSTRSAACCGEGEVNTMWLTSALFNAVIDEAPEVLSGVRQLLVGGEALSVPHVRRAQQLLPDTRIINGYGPTETTVFATTYTLDEPLPEDARSVPIGRPIGNTSVYVLDRHLAPVPVGVPGELHIGGPGLARGYLNSPELTARKFIPDPFSDDPAARLYKTGDRCRWLPDGNIEFLGRMDDQVKIRGFRVEPGETAAVLRDAPTVRDAAVIVREDEPGEKRLVAYVVLREGRSAGAAEDLRDYLADKLPEYMMPSAFVTSWTRCR